MARIFLTGGTGFIGSHFLRQALAAGHDVIALRRSGSKTRLELQHQPTWVDAALDNVPEESLRGVDALVHLAAHTPNPPYASLPECLYWNTVAPLQLALKAHEAGVRRFIVAGSCFEYGESAKTVDYVDISTPLRPTLSYPTSKAAASIAFEGFCREQNVELKMLRIFQVFGEGEQESRLWPSLRKAAQTGVDFPMSQGDQVRDFIPVEEVAAQFLRHVESAGGVAGEPEIHNVGTGIGQSLFEFAEHWWTRWHARGSLLRGALPYRPGGMARLVPKLP
jgi:nucleoside-diphosphate-sugar epimerase